MWYRLYPIFGDNILNPDCVALIAGIIASYDVDVAQLIVREICNRVVGTERVLVFPY